MQTYKIMLIATGIFFVSGDPAILHKLISEGVIDMQKINEYDQEFVADRAKECGIRISGKSKVCTHACYDFLGEFSLNACMHNHGSCWMIGLWWSYKLCLFHSKKFF